MRLLLRVFVVLALLLGIAVLATELVAKPFAERAVASQIRDERDLSTSPDVELDGFPFLFSVARGRLDSASVAIEDYIVEGLVVREATLELEGVEFAVQSLLEGDGDVTAEQATLVATVSDFDLNSWLATQGIPVTAGFAGSAVQVAGRLGVEGFGADVQASGIVVVEGGTLRFDPTEVLVGGLAAPGELIDAARAAVAFAVALPPVAGVQVTEVTVGEGQATLTADVTDYLLAGDGTVG